MNINNLCIHWFSAQNDNEKYEDRPILHSKIDVLLYEFNKKYWLCLVNGNINSQKYVNKKWAAHEYSLIEKQVCVIMKLFLFFLFYWIRKITASYISLIYYLVNNQRWNLFRENNPVATDMLRANNEIKQSSDCLHNFVILYVTSTEISFATTTKILYVFFAIFVEHFNRFNGITLRHGEATFLRYLTCHATL